MTSLDGINGRSIQTLLREENDSKQSDEFQAIRLNAAAFVKFFVIRVRRLFNIHLFLANNSMVTEHLNFKNRNMF